METKKWSLGIICLAFLFITCSSADEFLIRQVTDNSSYNLEEDLGLIRPLTRADPPSSKLLTITSFSVIKERHEPYESSVFESSGYKWRLILYVNGNKNDGGDGQISLYVRIEETESLPKDWEVNVDLKLFVKNLKHNKYLVVTDGAGKLYNEKKKEWGFGKMIALSTFYDANQGYIVQDTCAFGAEISILKPVKQQEKVTFISKPSNNVFTWKILHFSHLEDKFYYSDEFLVGDRYWRLGFHPEGGSVERLYLPPLYLFAQGFKPKAVATTTWGAVNLKLKNQKNSNHISRYSAAWYPITPGYGVGVVNLISMKDLKNPDKGFLVNDTVVFEAEMVKISVTNIVAV